MERRSVGEILVGLLPEGTTPTDASGERVSERTLNRKFVTGYKGSDSDTRGRLLNAAAVVVHAALEQLSPAPLQTAEELTREVRGVASPDPLRLALSKARTDKPPRRRLLQLLAQSGMAQSLIVSYMAAVARKEKMAVRSGCTYYAYYGCTCYGCTYYGCTYYGYTYYGYTYYGCTYYARAQILSPFVASYSLRHFNENFNLGLTPYQWRFARWHASIFLAAQTPIASATLRWRYKGAGADGTLPHTAIIGAAEFIAEYLISTAEGLHRVKLSSGRYQDFPAAQLQQCAEAVWRLYRDARGGDGAEREGGSESVLERSTATGARRVSRSHFLKLVELASQGVQKSYSALDTFSERHGRKQAENIRGYCEELKELIAKLLVASLLPAGAERAAAQRKRAAAVREHATRLKQTVDRVEAHLKRGLALHVLSCNSADEVT